MADRPPRKCTYPGCKTIGRFASAYCPDHQRQQDHERKLRHPALSNHRAWESFRQYLFACGNVVCQRVVDGRRCTRPTKIFHHLIAADSRPDLAFDWHNVVGVCASCHPRPEDKDQGKYVPTLWRVPMSDDRIEVQVLPGQVVTQETVLW